MTDTPTTAHVDLAKTVDVKTLMFSVCDAPDMPRRDQTRRPIVPQEVTLEYCRLDGSVWKLTSCEVHGRTRLRMGGVGDNWHTEIFHSRAGVGTRPVDQWPNWLAALAETWRPRT